MSLQVLVSLVAEVKATIETLDIASAYEWTNSATCGRTEGGVPVGCLEVYGESKAEGEGLPNSLRSSKCGLFSVDAGWCAI